MILTPDLNSHNQGNLDIWERIPRHHPMASKKRKIKMPTDKACWTCKYLGGWTGETFIQDFTCTLFPKYGKGEEKKLWPQKDPDGGCRFWEGRGADFDE